MGNVCKIAEICHSCQSLGWPQIVKTLGGVKKERLQRSYIRAMMGITVKTNRSHAFCSLHHHCLHTLVIGKNKIYQIFLLHLHFLHTPLLHSVQSTTLKEAVFRSDALYERGCIQIRCTVCQRGHFIVAACQKENPMLVLV